MILNRLLDLLIEGFPGFSWGSFFEEFSPLFQRLNHYGPQEDYSLPHPTA